MSKKFEKLEAGQGLVEYGLILALVAVAGVIVLSVFGSQIHGFYSNIVTMLNIDTGQASESEEDLSQGCQQGNGSSWITGFELVDAANDVVVGPISNGATVNLSNYGAINIIANAGGNTVRVIFSGSFNITENDAPFAVGGNSGGDYQPLGVSPGQATIRATPQDAGSINGTACELSLTFT